MQYCIPGAVAHALKHFYSSRERILWLVTQAQSLPCLLVNQPINNSHITQTIFRKLRFARFQSRTQTYKNIRNHTQTTPWLFTSATSSTTFTLFACTHWSFLYTNTTSDSSSIVQDLNSLQTLFEKQNCRLCVIVVRNAHVRNALAINYLRAWTASARSRLANKSRTTRRV